MQIAVVGPGRLGATLALLWGRVGHAVRLVGRNDPVGACDVAVLTVPDRAIAPCALRVPPGPVVLHTSGATDLGPLRPRTGVGSLHPLMTFPGVDVAVPALEGVGAAIDGDADAVRIAEELARCLGMVPFRVDGSRALYHASAVVAGNFATVLIAVAGDVLARASGVSSGEARRLLAPLALTSLRNAVASPGASLTGPVARGDEAVILGHEAALMSVDAVDELALYRVMTTLARRLRADLDPTARGGDGHD
jgi:predicted short-subunit dehydrogenase-like oxidoreductase (DUF2520 family)